MEGEAVRERDVLSVMHAKKRLSLEKPPESAKIS